MLSLRGSFQLPRPRLPFLSPPSSASSVSDTPSRSSSTSSLQLAFLTQKPSVMDAPLVPTFFHTLSEDCHVKIINFVDDPEEAHAYNKTSNNNNNNTEHGDTRRHAFISLLFSPVSPFLDSASTLFHTIILDADRPLSCVVSRGVIELGCTNNDFYMVPYVLRRVGEHVGRIEVVASGINSYESYVALLLQHCSCNVVKAIEFFGGELDDHFQASIEVLIGCFRDKLTTVEFPSYSNLCTSTYLAKLVATCANLRVFSYFGGNLAYLSDLWVSIGDSLEELFLAVNNSDDWDNCTHHMGTYCTRLKRCMLYELSEGIIPQEEYARLMCSYGRQLVEANVDFISDHKLLRDMAVACPNLRVQFKETENNFERFGTLGNRVKSLSIILQPVVVSGGDEAQEKKWEQLASAMAACSPQLLSLNINGSGCHSAYRYLFRTRMNYLENLKCTVKSDVSCIVESTSRLTSLEITCDEPITLSEKGSNNSNMIPDFGGIARANPQLRVVRIAERLDDRYSSRRKNTDVVKILQHIVDSFRSTNNNNNNRSQLQSLSIGLNSSSPGTESLRNLCVPLKMGAVQCKLRFTDSTFHVGRADGI